MIDANTYPEIEDIFVEPQYAGLSAEEKFLLDIRRNVYQWMEYGPVIIYRTFKGCYMTQLVTDGRVLVSFYSIMRKVVLETAILEIQSRTIGKEFLSRRRHSRSPLADRIKKIKS